MRLLVGLATGLLLIQSQIAIADQKVLVCQNKLTEAYLQLMPAFNTRMCQQYPARGYCDSRDKDVARANLCRNSGLPYSHKKTYTFESDALKGMTTLFAEGYTETCWGVRTDVQRFTILTTPTTISFVDKPDSFIIDRQTLEGGYGTRRDYACEVKEISIKKKL